MGQAARMNSSGRQTMWFADLQTVAARESRRRSLQDPRPVDVMQPGRGGGE